MTSGGPLAPATDAELEELVSTVEDWLARQLEENPVVAAAERDPTSGARRWLVRVEGEEKPSFTVWFDLRQRALHVETYVAPAPLENHAAVGEYLLRRNAKLRGLAFAIGLEDAVYLVAELPVAWVDDGQLDRMLGSMYEATEQSFRPVMRLGYGDRFTG